jgi:hypothetical protein
MLTDEEPRLRHIANSGFWHELRQALVDSRLITVETRSASGARKDFYRRHFRPEDLLLALATPPEKTEIADFLERFGVRERTPPGP